MSTQAKKIERRPHPVSKEIGKEELDQGIEIHVLTNTIQKEINSNRTTYSSCGVREEHA